MEPITHAILIGTAFLFVSFFANASALEEACQSRLAKPELVINVMKKDAPVEKVSLEALQVMNSASLALVKHAGAERAVVHGTVEAQPAVHSSLKGDLLKDATGTTCARPGITLDLEYAHLKMLLGEHLKEGSCEHGEIHDHEHRHVEAFHQALDLAVARTQARWAVEWSQRPILYGTAAEIQSQVREFRDEVARFAHDEILRAADRLNNEIDSLEEYARLGKVCNGGLDKMTRPD